MSKSEMSEAKKSTAGTIHSAARSMLSSLISDNRKLTLDKHRKV